MWVPAAVAASFAIEAVSSRTTGVLEDVFVWIYVIATYGSFTVLSIRRLNDIGESRWMLLFMLVPLANAALLLLLLFRKGISRKRQTDGLASLR